MLVNLNTAWVRAARTCGKRSGASALITISCSGTKLTMVPPPVLPGNFTSQSPPGFNSTDTSGASQLLNPLLVVNASQTSCTEAGIVSSILNTCRDSSDFTGPATCAEALTAVARRKAKKAILMESYL